MILRTVVRITRRGNSAHVSIPRPVMALQRWPIGQAVHLVADGDRIVVEAVKEPDVLVNARKVSTDAPAPVSGTLT